MTGRIALVGEAWGENEARERTPFVGAAGYELTRMLSEAGINRADCFITNVFNLQPKGNDIETLCGAKGDGIEGFPPLRPGKFIRREYRSEIERLFNELGDCRPTVIITLGNTPTWALLGTTGISKIRGTVAWSERANVKCLPTYHPAAVLRQWDLRPVTVLDLAKGKRESEFPEIRRPERSIWIEPSLEDMERFYDNHLRHCRLISFDIETSGNQITCIGFAPSPSIALVVPFHDPRREGRSYWPTARDERAAWDFVRRVLGLPQPKLAQNGIFDAGYLWRQYRIPVINLEHDSMLLHHSLYPESEKGLGFLGSVYTNEASWKLMARHKSLKKEE
jgi:uracil-DNA glycosylase